MATFHYVARTMEGQTVSGSIQAGSRLDATDQIRAMGYWLQELNAEADSVSPGVFVQKGFFTPIFGGVPLTTLSIFFRQFATLVGAGVPIHQTFHSLGNQMNHPRLRRVINEIRESVVSGENLADAFDRYPELFSPVQRAMIRVGVSGGMLEVCLKRIADYLDQEVELRRLLRRVTFYPKVLLFAAIVIPQVPALVLPMITGQGGDPRGVIFQITATFLWIILPLLAIWAVFRIGSQSRSFCYAWDLFKTSIPYIGFTIRQLALAKFGRALGALYGAGLPLSQAIRVASDAAGNEYIAANIRPIATKLETGRSIAESFQQARVFPPMVVDMVATGENAGELENMLTKVAEYYEEEGKVRSQQSGIVLGVVLYLAIAVYIATILISFYSGYFQSIFNAAGGP